jgi:16S rRNA (cytosine1402-N4)-methyltransferase
MIEDIHTPVLRKEAIDLLAPAPGESYLDLTAGYGGHAKDVLRLIGKEGSVTLVDRDVNSINYLKKKFAVDKQVEFIHSDFESASRELLSQNKKYDCILADLGVSSPHLDNPDRGFSFMNDGPLDMRMDGSRELTASKIVNEYDQQTIANLLFRYGELRNSRKIAQIIVQNRPFNTTNELSSVIPGQFKARMRTLAQVFQALRIEVNDELGQLERSLELWQQLLNPGGRLAVISFHSLEDRIVKQYFSEHAGRDMTSELQTINKKPITAGQDEIVHNPRARSAKLRALQRK